MEFYHADWDPHFTNDDRRLTRYSAHFGIFSVVNHTWIELVQIDLAIKSHPSLYP
jgi:hypothetical protein